MDDVAEKMGRIRALSDAIERQQQNCKDEPTFGNAVALQQLQQQRRALQELLPPIRLVN
jgi:hypothetical protein